MSGEATENGEDRFLRKKDVCGILGVSISTLDRRIKAGEFPKGIKFGERIRVWLASDVSEFIRSQKAQAYGI